ncbi:hypothetical protein CGRA01v4_04003 [Colletotrichum graminicola]|nr:hypothetical protein CGRA01v4_04003 [Colletotrichum graminicola]
MTKLGNPKGRQENWHRAKATVRLLQASLEHGPSPKTPRYPQSPGLACILGLSRLANRPAAC